MKKWIFWTVMCVVSLLNGGFFGGASFQAMRQGLDGVDNQAALIFIPFLWVVAAFVLILLNGYTLIRGVSIKREQIICLTDVFRLSGLSGRAKAGRITFIVAAILLMLFGYGLFAGEALWAVAYALSGGALLLFLYAWQGAAIRGADG